MAYIKDIWTKCDNRACNARALVEVYSWRNERLGQFCRKDGQRKLTRQKEIEVQEDAETVARAAAAGR